MSTNTFLKYRFVLVLAVHGVLVAMAWYGAWWLRLDRELWDLDASKNVDYLGRCTALLPWMLAVRLVCFVLFGLAQGLWRYVSLMDLVNLVKATLMGSVLFAAGLAIQGIAHTGTMAGALEFTDVPRLALVIEAILCLVLVGGIRFCIRVYRELFAPASRGGRPVLIVGAGDAGEMLLREMRTHRHLGLEPVGFLDDDLHKRGRKIHGVSVLGGIEDLQAAVDRTGAEEVIVAIRRARGEAYRRILEACSMTGVRLRRLPSAMSDIVSIVKVRNVALEDLLAREQARIDLQALRTAFDGKTVLVTGAGGSIGSEVVRQLCDLGPAKVVALDRAENQLFFLERELSVHHPEQRVLIRIGDCRDRAGMRALFEDVQPQMVVHAAAYKHVPLMEAHPVEAVRNNVQATLDLARLAVEYGTERFLLISSDKAVRPTSVMGATKRAAELSLQSLEPGATQLVAVRFGNVLGSQGSVVPLFQRQLREGGPLTVTHPDVVRFFMTIREAVGLVLQAGILGSGGEVFHLDMGRQVRVMDMAENLIRLSGFRPHEDIAIRIVGLRPGEKMHEELLAEGEDVAETDHERIRVLRTGPIDREDVGARVEDLLSAASLGRDSVIGALKELVPEYTPNNDDLRRVLAERAAGRREHP